MDGWVGGWLIQVKDCLQQSKKGFEKTKTPSLPKKRKKEKNSPHLSCDLHKIGANLYSKLPVSPFCAKKYGPGWMDGWMGEWMDGWVGGRAKDCLQQSKIFTSEEGNEMTTSSDCQPYCC